MEKKNADDILKSTIILNKNLINSLEQFEDIKYIKNLPNLYVDWLNCVNYIENFKKAVFFVPVNIPNDNKNYENVCLSVCKENGKTKAYLNVYLSASTTLNFKSNSFINYVMLMDCETLNNNLKRTNLNGIMIIDSINKRNLIPISADLIRFIVEHKSFLANI